MKKIVTFLLLVLSSLSIGFSQNDQRIAATTLPLSAVELADMPYLDNDALLAAEMERRVPGVAPHFAENIAVDISPNTHGTWENLPGEKSVWRMRIRSEGAKSLNLGFTKYYMPKGGTMVLYSPDFEQIMGPFSPSDNEEHEQLWTPILPGDELVIEVALPAELVSELKLQLKFVNHDFLGFGQIMSGSCNLDVVCGEVDGFPIVDLYRDIIRSVANIGTNGNAFCTGFLVNNARNDCTPYFMTANHCGVDAGNAASFVAYWNYENSTCRQPGSPASGQNGNGSQNDFNTGAIFRAGGSTSDFTLIELDDPVSATANAYYAGWNATGVPQDTSICVHHPSNDEKRITFDFETAQTGNFNGGSDPTHWYVDWDLGVTEPGSSGSPLFDQNHRAVGQLHGGPSSCSNSDKHDYYGMFHLSWTGDGTPATSLKPWLDPDNTGVLELDGRNFTQCNFYVDVAPASILLCAPADAVYNLTVSQQFASDVTLSVIGPPTGLTFAFATNPVAPGGSTALTVSNTGGVAAGTYTLNVQGSDGTDMTVSQITLQIVSGAPPGVDLQTPPDGEDGTALIANLNWADQADVSFSLQLSPDENFSNLLADLSGLNDPFAENVALLNPVTTYYWRVRVDNICGAGEWSPTFHFTTGAIICGNNEAADVPVPISDLPGTTVTSQITVTSPGLIEDLNISNLNIAHSYVSDLLAILTSPSGTQVAIFNRNPGGLCSSDNLVLAFDDEAALGYQVFIGTCNIDPPAISGTFHPEGNLSDFDGETAAGVWTLTIVDDFDQDGGALESWELDICATLPGSATIIPTSVSLDGCIDGSVIYDIIIGTGFLTDVTLTAANLPPGASAVFSQNPATPGTLVEVTVSGLSDPGNYSFDLTADDGMQTDQVNLLWNVIPNPDAPLSTSPGNLSQNQPYTVNFTWEAVANADSYTLEVAFDPGFTNLVFAGGTVGTNLPAFDLNPCTTYYWRVFANGFCGVSDASEVFSFTTQDDLSFISPSGNLAACAGSSAIGTLILGSCFDLPGVTLSGADLPPGASITFSNNPNPAGSTLVYTLNLSGVTPGNYIFGINGTDGSHDVTINLGITVQPPALAPIMLAPVNNATGVGLQVNCDWQPSVNASGYFFELATDANFSNVIQSATTSIATNYIPNPPLEYNTQYWWRVAGINACGSYPPTAFTFNTLPVAVYDLLGSKVKILPNPTAGKVFIQLSQPLAAEMEAVIYSIDGRELQHQRLAPGSFTTALDLSDCTAGIYVVKLIAANAIATERIVLEK